MLKTAEPRPKSKQAPPPPSDMFRDRCEPKVGQAPCDVEACIYSDTNKEKESEDKTAQRPRKPPHPQPAQRLHCKYPNPDEASSPARSQTPGTNAAERGKNIVRHPCRCDADSGAESRLLPPGMEVSKTSSAVNAMVATAPPFRFCRVFWVGTASPTLIVVAALISGCAVWRAQILAVGEDVVDLLGAVASPESVVAADTLNRSRRVGDIAAFATNPKGGTGMSGRLDCRHD